MKAFSIYLYRDKDFEKFKDYISAAFHPRYILTNPDYIKWQYNGQFCIAKDGEKIIGHFGFRDQLYKIYDKSQKIRTLISLHVLDDYRLLGVAPLLATKVFDTNNPVLVSGYTPVAQKLFSHFRKNWKETGNLSRYFAVLNPDPHLLKDLKIPKVEREDIVGRVVENFTDGELEEFWSVIRRRFPVSTERTSGYLRWRFLNHPFLKYRLIVSRDSGKINGYLIFRFEEDKDFKIARIIDFISDPKAEKILLSGFLKIAEKEKAQAADFMYSGNFYKSSLLKTGFFNVSGTDFEKFPILFSPLSTKKFFINIAYDLNYPLKDCYFTKAEGDQDRPNPVPHKTISSKN